MLIQEAKWPLGYVLGTLMVGIGVLCWIGWAQALITVGTIVLLLSAYHCVVSLPEDKMLVHVDNPEALNEPDLTQEEKQFPPGSMWRKR